MNPQILAKFLTSLSIMWQGMLGIFVVMLILMLLIFLLTKYVK